MRWWVTEIASGGLAVALAVIGPVGVARAGGFEIPDQSAVAGGTGGAGTARPADPSAAFYNPAALADGAGFRGALGVLLAVANISAQAIEEPMERAGTVSGVSPPPHLHLSYAEQAWAVGGYLGISHGSRVAWPEGWWGRYEAMSSELLVLRIAPFFALRLGGEHGLVRDWPDVRLALAAHVDVARAESRRMLDFIDREGQVHLLFWGAGVGGGASLYWQVTPELSIGLAYRSRTWMRASGDADFTVPEPFIGRAPDQHASTEIVMPDRLVLGAAWTDRTFAVLADIGFSAWSVRDRQRVDFERESTPDTDVPQHWHDTLVFRLGGELSPIEWLHARVGIEYDMEAAPAETLAPSAPDMARWRLTFGAGFDVTREFGVDASYAFVALLGRESNGDDAPLARYAGEAHIGVVTLRLELGATATTAVRDAQMGSGAPGAARERDR